jgi:HEPN domain-containing protein
MEKTRNEKINDYYQLAQYHMKLAHIMRNHNQFRAAFSLCHSALTSMIRALYLYKNKTDSSSEMSIIDLLLLVHTEYNPGLDIVVFIGELNYVVNGEGQELEVIKDEDMKRVILRAKEVLSDLCKRMED